VPQAARASIDVTVTEAAWRHAGASPSAEARAIRHRFIEVLTQARIEVAVGGVDSELRRRVEVFGSAADGDIHEATYRVVVSLLEAAAAAVAQRPKPPAPSLGPLSTPAGEVIVAYVERVIHACALRARDPERESRTQDRHLAHLRNEALFALIDTIHASANTPEAVVARLLSGADDIAVGMPLSNLGATAVAVAVASRDQSHDAVLTFMNQLRRKSPTTIVGAPSRIPVPHALALVPPATGARQSLDATLTMTGSRDLVLVFDGPFESRRAGSRLQQLRADLRVLPPAGEVQAIWQHVELEPWLIAYEADLAHRAREALGAVLYQSDCRELLRTMIVVHTAGEQALSARRLGLSKSGLRYRIQRIRRLTGLDLRRSSEAIRLVLAAAWYLTDFVGSHHGSGR
jgi:hypothetical protein